MAATDRKAPGTAPRRRPRKQLEPTDIAAMMVRMTRAYAARVADADMEDLADLMKIGQLLDQEIAKTIQTSRERHGWSWSDIARAATLAGVPMTRQAAQQKWGS